MKTVKSQSRQGGRHERTKDGKPGKSTGTGHKAPEPSPNAPKKEGKP